MSPDSLQTAADPIVTWGPILLDGVISAVIGGVAGGLVGWYAAIRVQKRLRSETQQDVVRKLLAATVGMIGDLRAAHRRLHNAEAQDDLSAVRAVFEDAEDLLSSDDEDRFAAVVSGGAEQLDQSCLQRWLDVQTAAKEVAQKHERIRGRIALGISDADLPHHVTVYRGLLQNAITSVEDALQSTRPYAAPDSLPTLTQLLLGPG